MPSVTRKSSAARTRRAAAETAVFDAVERLMAKGASYTELGVAQIADEAGIGRSTFYVHFADKTDLLIRLTRASTAELFGAAEAWLSQTSDDGIEPLEHALLEVCRQRRRHPAAMNALSEVAGYDQVIAEFWRERIDAFADRFARKLTAERRQGRTAPGLDPKATATFLTWGVERTVEQHSMMGDSRNDAKVARAMARAVWLAAYGHDPRLE